MICDRWWSRRRQETHRSSRRWSWFFSCLTRCDADLPFPWAGYDWQRKWDRFVEVNLIEEESARLLKLQHRLDRLWEGPRLSSWSSVDRSNGKGREPQTEKGVLACIIPVFHIHTRATASELLPDELFIRETILLYCTGKNCMAIHL